MGASKTTLFQPEQNNLATMAKALSHPARIAILEYLAKSKTCICGDIVDELPLSQATVSQHLKELKNACLITGEIEGPKVCYCINVKAWKQGKEMISQFMQSITDTCC